MAEIRCPMCSRLSPEESDVCPFCQARLKPLVLNQTPTPDPAPSNGKTSPPEDEIPEWLRTLREKKAEETPASEAEGERASEEDSAGGAAMDWELPDLTLPEAPSEPEVDTSDWLERIRQRSQEGLENEPPEPEMELTWETRQDMEDIPSNGSQPSEDELSAKMPEQGEAANEPDWLERLRTSPLDPSKVPAQAADALQKPPDDSIGSVEESISAWEESVQEPELREYDSMTPPGTEAAEDMPDWLQGLVSEPQVSEATADETPEGSEAADAFESQLTETEDELPAPDNTLADEPQAEALAVDPDKIWPLAEEFPGEGPIPTEPPTAEILPFSTDLIPEWEEPQAQEPAPVANLGEQALPAEPAPALDQEIDYSATQPAIAWDDGALPDWLASIQSDVETGETGGAPAYDEIRPSFEAGAGEEEPADADLPDWLIGLGAVQMEDDAQPEDLRPIPSMEAEPGGEIAPAELPNWIQAMRPIETITPEPAAPPEAVEEHAEKTGPLAGLSGVLPVHPVGVEYRKAPSYAVQLKTSETQSAYAQILEDMVAGETTAQPRPAPKEISRPQMLLRAAVAVVMLAAIIYPIITGLRILPVPNLYPQEILNVRSEIEALPENSAVLLVTDYEPALSGELESSAAGVVDHLMARSARLAVLSTQPTGMVLASNLFDKVWQQGQPYHQMYQNGENLAYLGYLAGGPGGMLSFAQTPQLAVPGLLSDGTTAWGQPALKAIETPADFTLVVVMTDSAETGRAWVEQVRPYLEDTPLLFVTSTQAAPVLYPYLDSQQIYGMVSGLAGGAAYEQIRGQAGLASAHWDAFQTGLLVAIAMILIGGVTNGVIGAVKNRTLEDEA